LADSSSAKRSKGKRSVWLGVGGWRLEGGFLGFRQKVIRRQREKLFAEGGISSRRHLGNFVGLKQENRLIPGKNLGRENRSPGGGPNTQRGGQGGGRKGLYLAREAGGLFFGAWPRGAGLQGRLPKEWDEQGGQSSELLRWRWSGEVPEKRRGEFRGRGAGAPVANFTPGIGTAPAYRGFGRFRFFSGSIGGKQLICSG